MGGNGVYFTHVASCNYRSSERFKNTEMHLVLSLTASDIVLIPCQYVTKNTLLFIAHKGSYIDRKTRTNKSGAVN